MPAIPFLRSAIPTPAGPRAVPALRTALALACTLAAGLLSATELSEAESAVFMGSGRCALCHDTSTRALRDAQGTDLAIVADWRSTMMANSFRDPLWRAKVGREVEENPRLQSLIEDKCTRCHAPMPNSQAHLDGTSPYPLAAADQSELAADGVSCTLCHQIQAEGLGKRRSFTGGYLIGKEREIFGPYPEVFPMPMRNHTNYTPVHGPQVQKSELCATCHTVYTPILDAEGKVTGEFPEQTPYLEWRHSDFAREGTQCQDCHMPKIDEAVRISSMPPWLDNKQQPFWRHAFVGGNTLVPAILAQHAAKLGATATPAQFAATTNRAREQLRQATASLRLDTKVKDNLLLASVTVQNRTGHKFPTGFPSRRAWLHLRVSKSNGEVLFESGDHRDGRLVHEPASWQPHHREISDPTQTQVYEAVMADTAGQPTTTLLHAASYLKDNRLPPRGFLGEHPQAAHVAIIGEAAKDPDFHPRAGRGGGGSDLTRYRITLPEDPGGELTVTAELFYQPLKPAFADHLLAGQAAAVQNYRPLHQAADHTPVLVEKQQRNVRVPPAT